jgi:hypothetical protein
MAGVPLFEDDPYRDLVFDACDRRPVCAGIEGSPWIYQGSFSKSLAPGLRLGFLAASPELLHPLVRLKQAADLHSNRLSQWLVLQQLEAAGRPARLARLADFYRAKRDAFDAALRRHFGALADWQTPAGGLFFWLKLSARSTPACPAGGHQRGVAFMPGEAFYASDAASAPCASTSATRPKPRWTSGLAKLAELVASAARRGSRARAGHLAGPHPGVELLAGHVAQRQRRLAQGEAGVVGVLGDGRGAVVADVRAERRHQHQRARHQLGDARPIHLDAPGAVGSKLAMPSASRRTLARKLWAISGLKTFSSKLPDAPPTVIATSLPNTWQHTIVSASHWVGLTLPGMIELPGSFSGITSSPSPERGPRPASARRWRSSSAPRPGS